MNWEVIIPFLRPIEDLIRDPDITDILVNGSKEVFIEKLERWNRYVGASYGEVPADGHSQHCAVTGR